MINGAPEVMTLTVDLYKYLVQVPLPVRVGAKLLNPPLADFGCEQRAKPISPKPHCLVARSLVREAGLPRFEAKVEIGHTS